MLWVNASTQTQLHEDLARIGNILQVPEAKKPRPKQRYLVNEVLHWLQTHRGWLLILDNVEESLDTEDAHDVKIDHVLSTLKEGHILLTTRLQSVARLAQSVLLEEMLPEEGMQLLLLRSNQQSSPNALRAASRTDRENALILFRLLGGLPLALEQARAYIEATGCGFAGYIQLYEDCRKQLLGEVKKNSRLEREYKESVATTWLISFRQVEQQMAVASEVLKLYAYLAPDAIPEDILLRGAEKLASSLQQLAGNRFQFNQACEVLLNYALIKRNAYQAEVSMHRLVQAVLQDRMEDDAQHFWAEQAVQAVEHAFSDALSRHQDFDRYLPHARLCATFIKKLQLKGQGAAHLLEIAANAVYERGWYAQARPLYLRAHASAMDLLGATDPHVLSLLLDVARVHMDLGAAPFAAKVYRRVKEELEQLFGPEYPEIVICLNNLALAELKTGNLVEAEQAVKDALARYGENLLSDAGQRATTYAIAARIAENLHQVHSAEAYYKAALEIQKQVFGMDHPEVAKSLADFGNFYLFHRKDLEQAEPLLRQALEIRQKALGHDHPDTAESLVHLAILYWDQKNYARAEECYQQALAIRQQKLGLYHPGIVHILHDLAELTAEQRRDEEAEQYFREMLAIAPYAGGTESYEYALQMEAYANFLRERGRRDEAEEYHRQIAALTRRLSAKGPLHTLNFSHRNEEGQEIASDQMWFFRHGDSETF